MNIRDMHYLVAVADHLNFSKAAESCNVSQPTLSGQIKKLEEQLGIIIFERTNKKVMLTDIGTQIIASARRILHESEHIKEIARYAQNPLSGIFRLGAFPTLATYIFPTLVPKITESLPDIRLILAEDKTAHLIEKLHKGELDAALLALPIDDDAFITQPLFDDAFMLAVPANHPLAHNAAIKQSELAQHRVLLLEEGHCLRDQALDVCTLHNIGEDTDLRATGLETLRLMVKAGTGITFMPRIAVREDEEGICYIPFAAPEPKRTIGLVWRKTSARGAVMERLVEMMASS